MSATQELSQWVRDPDKKSSNNEDTLTYTPGQPGYVGFEDLEIGSSQPVTQPEITPLVETRIERYPETKRFVEPETPVPGGKISLGRNSSESNEFQTPQLPINPFANPFGPAPGEENGVMGLTQVFRATQAVSSPNLLRRPHIPSSQRPSPNVVTRNVFDIPSDMVSEKSSGGVDLEEIPEGLEPSSPIDSIISSASVGSKIARQSVNEDEHVELDGEEARNINQSRMYSPIGKTIKTLSKTRKPRSAHRADKRSGDKAVMVEDAQNTSEEETELEDEDDIEDAMISTQDDNSEGNKENRIVQQSRELQPGLGIKRAPQSMANMSIPLSSSPALARNQLVVEINHVDDGLDNDSQQKQSSPSLAAVQPGLRHTEPPVTIADSQSSQKLNNQRSLHNPQTIVGSSNDSRKIIPQSQAARPQSSLHAVSTAPNLINLGSQQTLSPPQSSSGSRKNIDPDIASRRKHIGHAPNVRKPVSPRSSPPLPTHDQEQDHAVESKAEIGQAVDENDDDDVSNDVFTETGLTRRQSGTLVSRTPALRGARYASAIPETTFHNRHGDGFSTTMLAGVAHISNGFDDIDFSFQGPLQNDNNGLVENRSLAASFGSRRSENVLTRPSEISPAKPRAFSALTSAQSQSQEPESLEFSVFNTQDREVYDAIARHPGTGSSPLPAGRKRRRGNNRAPILLDDISSDDLSLRGRQESPLQRAGHQPQSISLENDCEVVLEAEVPESANGLPRRDHDEDLEEEDVPFLGQPTPTKTYGKRQKRSQKPPGPPATAPPGDTMPTTQATRKRGRPPKSSFTNVSRSDLPKKRGTAMTERNRDAEPTGRISILKSQSSTKATPSTSYTTARTQQSTFHESKQLDSTAEIVPFLVPNRVFAKFRGSSPGFFAATCLDCFDDELERKYNVRFDDGTVDQIGQKFVKRLEFRIGDEVKVDRRQMKTSVFTVQGFGDKIDENTRVEEEYPMTDVHGYETIHLVEKLPQDSRKKTKHPQELEIPVTEIFFTIGMWSGVRQRDYQHAAVKVEVSGSPNVIKIPSNFNSPQSRTRSTNKINAPGLSATSFSAQAAKITTPIVAATGLFKSIAFVVTGVQPDERDDLIKTIARHGGIVLDGFQELFAVPQPKLLSDTGKVDDIEHGQSEKGKSSSDLTKALQLRPAYTNVRLAVLISEKANRNTKYFQALALGIPCLSLQWIRHCLQAGKLKDWRPYMLAAGKSTILLSSEFGTSCSQQLNLTHQEIADPNLSLGTVLNRRPQWLHNARVLIIGNGDQESMPRSQAHAFLISFLGASEVVIAEHPEQAKQHSSNGPHGFDWICIDNETSKDTTIGRGGRANKRSSTGRKAALPDLNHFGQAKEISIKLMLESLIVGSLLSKDDVKEQDE